MLASKFRSMLRRSDRGEADVRARASYQLRPLRRDEAEVGVGTLIIFIAMVLVAAVAAAVIIGTSGSLQQRAQATGKEATAEVSSNMNVVGMYGQRNNTGSNLWNLHVYMTLSAGSVPIDLNQTIVRYGDGSADFLNIKHNDFANYGFTLSWVRGSGVGAVAQTGDLVDLNFTMKNTELAPRTDFTLQILNAVGAPVELMVRTPPTYAADTHVLLK